LLQFWHLDLDDLYKKLILQTTRCDSEIDECNLDANLWQVVRILELGCDEEQEVLVVWDPLLSKLE